MLTITQPPKPDSLISIIPEIGGETYFLRPSALDKLVNCPVNYMLSMGEDDEGGTPAQTGSLVHAAVAAYHETAEAAEKVKAAFDALALNAGKFPLADLNEARLYLTPYVSDPRNSQANVIAVEHSVQLKLDPHPLDPTGKPIYIRGTLDQIRLEGGIAYVCDLKTGQKPGWEMIHVHAYQQAAYVLAARESGFPNAVPGFIIRNYGYRARSAVMPSPNGVMFALPFDVDGARLLMDRVRLSVAMIRGGNVEFGPGAWCNYCHHKGLPDCIPKANRLLFALPMSEAA